jgi:aminopeptidase
MTSLYERYADLLVRYCVQANPGSRVYVRSSYLAEPLLGPLYRALTKAGAHYDSKITIRDEDRTFAECASDSQIEDVSPAEKLIYETYDAFVSIRAPFNLKSMQSVPPATKKKLGQAKGVLHDIFSDRSASGALRWTLCEFPTDAAAQECGMSLAEYERFVFSACRLFDADPVSSWLAVRESQQRAVDRLNRASAVRYVNADTDITFSVSGRKWINSDGRRNMPSGEVFTSPVEDSVNGYIRFSYPGIYMGEEIEDIRLEVKGGLVVAWSASRGAEFLDRIMEIDGARRFGEAAIGTNAGISRFTKNMLFDEKMGGTIHMALGSTYKETGGKNESAIHWDLLADMRLGEILADGECIYRNGSFLF